MNWTPMPRIAACLMLVLFLVTLASTSSASEYSTIIIDYYSSATGWSYACDPPTNYLVAQFVIPNEEGCQLGTHSNFVDGTTYYWYRKVVRVGNATQPSLKLRFLGTYNTKQQCEEAPTGTVMDMYTDNRCWELNSHSYKTRLAGAGYASPQLVTPAKQSILNEALGIEYEHTLETQPMQCRAQKRGDEEKRLKKETETENTQEGIVDTCFEAASTVYNKGKAKIKKLTQAPQNAITKLKVELAKLRCTTCGATDVLPNVYVYHTFIEMTYTFVQKVSGWFGDEQQGGGVTYTSSPSSDDGLFSNKRASASGLELYMDNVTPIDESEGNLSIVMALENSTLMVAVYSRNESAAPVSFFQLKFNTSMDIEVNSTLTIPGGEWSIESLDVTTSVSVLDPTFVPQNTPSPGVPSPSNPSPSASPNSSPNNSPSANNPGSPAAPGLAPSTIPSGSASPSTPSPTSASVAVVPSFFLLLAAISLLM